MSDMRFDPIFEQWVAVSEVRRERPLEFFPADQLRKQIICPFCRGNEDETPGPIAAWDRHGRKLELPAIDRWSTRVIPNKYPTYEDGGRKRSDLDSGPYRTCDMPGLQELIIPTPRHVCSLSELEVDEFSVALIAAQQRIAAWRQSQSVEHAMLFKNCRHEAGASIEHTHFQLIGSPLVSGPLQQRAARFSDSLGHTGATPLERLVAFEEQQGLRVIARGRHFVMLCPFASRMAFQVWIIPRRRPAAFWDCPPDMLEELAELGQSVVAKLEPLLSLPGYNWMLHQLPFAEAANDHWFVEIIPRLSKIAGYELGTEIWVNAVSPEAAVKRLR
ncbi:MAG: DUF4921 family protein [Planctomycetota bacterium]